MAEAGEGYYANFKGYADIDKAPEEKGACVPRAAQPSQQCHVRTAGAARAPVPSTRPSPCERGPSLWRTLRSTHRAPTLVPLRCSLAAAAITSTGWVFPASPPPRYLAVAVQAHGLHASPP